MSNRIVRWKHVEYFFSKHIQDYYIIPRVLDKIITGPKNKKDGKRQTVRISHECSHVGSSEVTRPYLKLIERIFHITASEILSAYQR